MIKLFLDDYRCPTGAYKLTRQGIYLEKGWKVVKNYNQFVKFITKKGMPDLISFDHDLSDEHYTPEIYWDDYEASKEYQEKVTLEYKEKTGFECAKWLTDYCMDNNLDIPKYLVHSQNPVGKDNIIGILESFKRFKLKHL